MTRMNNNEDLGSESAIMVLVKHYIVNGGVICDLPQLHLLLIGDTDHFLSALSRDFARRTLNLRDRASKHPLRYATHSPPPQHHPSLPYHRQHARQPCRRPQRSRRRAALPSRLLEGFRRGRKGRCEASCPSLRR
jgi:hypothetical protein